MPFSSIVMSYRENCKAEGEIMTGFKIARMFFAEGEKQTDIAEYLGCHRNTVYGIIRSIKGRDDPAVMGHLISGNHITLEELSRTFGFLKHESRKPKTNCRQLNTVNAELVIKRHTDLNGGPRRIFKQLKREGIDMSIFTFGKIKGVFKSNQLSAKKVRTANGERRALYNYDEISAFEYLQYDTKKIADMHSLPREIYEKFKHNPDLPLYQWTIVDAKTKTRFLAWSYFQNSFFGYNFLLLVVLWLRSHGIWTKINVQFDGGPEFCSLSAAKTEQWNSELEKYNVRVYDHGGSKWKQNLVERTHRTDDEEFYCPRGQFINSKNDFIVEGQLWIIYYNFRENDGIGMNGLSPVQKLESLGVYNAQDICRFPCLILEDYYRTFMDLFNPEYQEKFLTPKSQNVLTHYRNLNKKFK